MSTDGFDLRGFLSNKKAKSKRKVTHKTTLERPSVSTSTQLQDIGRKRARDDQGNSQTLKRQKICHNDRPTTKVQYGRESISVNPANPRLSGRTDSHSGANNISRKRTYVAEQNNNCNNPRKLKAGNAACTMGAIMEHGHPIFSKPLKTGESISRNFNNQTFRDASTTPTPMSYTCLKNLSDDHIPPEETSLKLTQHAQLQRFEALLQQSEPIRYDLMKMIISVIDKVGQSRIPTHLNIILGVINKTRFWSTLGIFIAELETTKECLADAHVSFLLKNLCKIFIISLERLPNLHSHIPIHQLQSVVKFFKENESFPIDSTVDILLTDVEGKFNRVKKGIRERGQSQAEPPDDFRTLSVFPTAEDILKGGKPFLRENIVKKPFSSVDQYLDIHFRLLKEDSLASLRNGVQDLRRSCRQQQYGQAAVDSLSKSSSARAKNDVIVYNEVVINDQVTTNRRNETKGIVYNVAFNSNHPSIKHVNWERSKRLLFGSLVCLISTDFQNVHFATVGNRDPKMLKEGFIQLCFEGNVCPDYDNMQDEYRMVESSSAYFVAYRHILQRLQQIKDNTMPFKDYIVFCEHKIAKPTYYKVKSEEENPKTINLTSVAKTQLSRESLKNISPLDLSIWPDGKAIGLNDSQYRAFQSALQREFALIQGPPGTGKTYLGLKIAHTLLDNNHLWKDTEDDRSCPILMLAYTNHALDSFLEQLTIDIRDVIRVGGRSSSEALKECNINIVRRERQNESGLRRSSGIRFREVQRAKGECEASLNKYTDIYAKSFKGILPARELKKYMLVAEHGEYLSNDKTMLEFLEIFLNLEVKQSATKFADEDEVFEEFNGHELGGHFYVGCLEVDEKRESRNEVLICSAEETLSPKGLLELLKTEMHENERIRNKNLEVRILGEELLLLSAGEKWCLYLLWLTQLREDLRVKIREKQTKHVELSNEYEELRNIVDLGIMRNSRVVGMTTTCASKNHKLLQQLRPRVVIIEEAAELFEAHIVTCLTEHCEHLILIGDHQQLRPNPSVYNLSKQYSLDVSLLERMIEAGVPYNRLSVQHRMRPEISKIFRHIYEGLEDHTSVMEYENIRGVTKNLFFVDHDVRESAYDNIHSKVNQHEAEFLVELCLYLLRQGYKSSQITILTTYTGQMFKIRDLVKSKKDEFEDDLPRVSNVDNFQGEENDIILLSLVRNNEEENIGFLKTKNRVCVALSRARKGLYITGNRKMLMNQSPLWQDVLTDFDQNGCIGKSLPLACSIHQTKNPVTSAADFREFVPNGGCLKKCEDRLGCGHACPQMCHPNGHENFKCEKPCTRNVSGCDVSGHKCTNLCHEMCDDICQYPVVKVLRCGHTMKLPCSVDERTEKCKEQCEKTLPCGHRCQSRCNAPCTQQCQELVKKVDFSCGHENTIACSATQKDCAVPCGANLECDHPCVGKCGQCIQGRVHMKCSKKCNRILICSHPCKSTCSKNCPPCKEDCARKCYNNDSKCKKKCGEICVPCSESCLWECDHHKCTKLCNEMCDRPRCNEPCNRELTCGKGKLHFCRSLCGERCICIICHKNNDADVTTILFGSEDEEDARFIRLKDCEHIFEYTALDRMMDSNDDSGEIKTKVCPLCSVPIVKSLRYGNVVKKIHQDIDDIKRRILDSTELVEKTTQVKKLESELSPEISMIQMKSSSIERWKRISNYISKCELSSVYYQDILLMECILRLLKYWLCIKKSYEEAIRFQIQSRASTSQIEFLSEMENVLSRILVIPSQTSDRILNQLNLELQRMSLKRNLLLFNFNCSSLKVTLNEVDEKFVNEIQTQLQHKEIIEEDSIEKFMKGLSDIYSRNPHIAPVTNEEKIKIVRAIGLKQGHWFKCPNGHFYAIGECGGAMEESKCPECGAIIGGQHHRLASDNEVATEMDGAKFPAWSDQANMGNYQIDD